MDLEETLRGGRVLVGTRIRMQDGAFWTVPPMPLEGPASDQLTALLVDYWAQADKLTDDTPADARGPIMAGMLRTGAHIAYAALRLNYPALAREQLAALVSKGQLAPIVRAVNGIGDVSEVTGGNPPGAAS